jgi:tetratricopeptide (TPR) repeat protein
MARLPPIGPPGSVNRSRSSPNSKFAPTSQARFGYLGHLSLRDGPESEDALRNVSALDGTSFMPSVMVMQRAPTPWQYNTQSRRLEEPVGFSGGDAQSDEGEVTFPGGPSGVGSQSVQKEIMPSQPLPTNYVRRVRCRAQKALHGTQKGNYKKLLADQQLLADSASRSGNVHQALQAYHRMGVTLDNAGQYRAAIQKYKQFLSLCITSKNTQGEALAYNCLGINYFKIGDYDEAIQYHNQHLELADGTGRLIAHTNLGITFQAMGLSEHAAIHHQHAIEYANRSGAKDAQCFAVGNLGIASAAQGDMQTSKICLQYHLTTAKRQQKQAGSSKFVQHTLKMVSNDAHHRLGQVSAIDGDFDEASKHFAHAIEVAKSKRDQPSEEKSSVMFGVAEGLKGFADHRDKLLQAAAVAGEGKADWDGN